jgi:hypothetical protein
VKLAPRLRIFEVKRLKLMFGDLPTVVRHLVQGALDHVNVITKYAARFHCTNEEGFADSNLKFFSEQALKF